MFSFNLQLSKKKSLVKRESTNAVDDVTTTSVTGSTLSGKTVTITSAQDVTGQSAQIIGENAVSITAGGKVELDADKSITDGSSTYRHKKSGLLGGAGIGFSIGKEKHNIDEANHEESTVRNTIASTKGTVNIKANDTVHLTSADIVAKEGAVLDGSAVKLDGNVDHNHMTHDERYKKTGLTVSLGGAIANTLTNTTRTIKQAGGRDDKRLAALELNEARKQLQDGYEAVDKAINGVKLRGPEGEVLKENGHSKRGAKNIDDAINLSVSIGSTSRKQGQVVDTNTYQGGTLVSDGNVHIIARDAQQNGIGLTGETVEAKKLVLDSASDINLEAGKNTVDVNNTYKSSGWSVGAGISLTGGGLLDINASGHMARQNGDTHQESYVPTKIKAVELAQLKAKRDTNIIGSTVSSKKVEVDTGRDLHIQSLQDVDNFKEHSKSAGFSVSSKPNFKDPTGSINASVGRIDSKWKSVTHQAGIYAGEEGYNLNVGNSTTLEGAVIKSDAPKAKNKLTTKSLEMKDIKNEAEYTYSNNGIGYNYHGSKKKLEEMKTKDKKGYDKIYNSIGLVPNLGVGSKDKASSTTQSAISDGILTVDGKEIDTKTINTNTENTLHQLDKIFDKKKIEERQELARLFAKNAFEEVHRLSDKYHWKEGGPEKVALHAAIGEIASQLAGNPNGSGAMSAGVNELAIKKIIDKVGKNHPDQAQILSAALGGTVNKLLDKPLSSGAAVSSYGTKWNYEGIRVPREYPIAAYLNADGTYQYVDEYGNKINREDIKIPDLVVWVEKEYNTGIGYTMMINRGNKPDVYFNGAMKEQGKGKKFKWVSYAKTDADTTEYRSLSTAYTATSEPVRPMDPIVSNFTERKRQLFDSLGFSMEESLKNYGDPLKISWSGVVSSLDYKASKVADRYLPIGTIMNYGAMLKEDGDFNKYGVTGAATRVRMDVVYIGGMLYAGSRLKPLKGAAFSHVLDTAFSDSKDSVAPPLSETAAKNDFNEWYVESLHKTE